MQTMLANSLDQKNIASIEAHNITQRIKIRQAAINLSCLDQGRDLIKMCEHVEISPNEKMQRFALLGYETFESYVTGEIDIEIRTAYLYKQVVQKFIIDLGVNENALNQIGISKLGLLCYHVNEQNVFEWLAKAAVLTRNQLLEEIDDLIHGSFSYDAQKRPFSHQFVIDWNEPRERIAQRTIAFLLNQILELRPEFAQESNAKTITKVLQFFENE